MAKENIAYSTHMNVCIDIDNTDKGGLRRGARGVGPPLGFHPLDPQLGGDSTTNPKNFPGSFAPQTRPFNLNCRSKILIRRM